MSVYKMPVISFPRWLRPSWRTTHAGCALCEHIQILVERWRFREDCSPWPCPIDFATLDAQARRGCVGCRLFRRALLTASITSSQAQNLLNSNGHLVIQPVPRPTPDPRSSQIDLDLSIGISTCGIQTHVACVRTNTPQYLDLEYTPSAAHSIRQVAHWYDECRTTHKTCGNLAWSPRTNPKYLIRIFGGRDECGPRLLKIVEGSSIERVGFVALSYTWGDKTILGSAWNDIRMGKTTTENLATRMQGFWASDLPRVMESAVNVSKSLGIDYIWIDNVCIGGLLIWEDEAYRMHEVYSNAALTLCACAAESAVDDLLAPREAWLFKSLPVCLGGRSLVEYDLPLEQVRLQAPMFQRGWTLQEERLSPRIVYWCGQRLYWSCHGGQSIELEPTTPFGPLVCSSEQTRPLERATSSTTLRLPQEFLYTCWTVDKTGMHEQWLDMVQAYVRRSMFEPGDRLVAITGLAALYLDKWSDTHVAPKQAFLAGLWRTTFAQDLAWRVQQPQNPDRSLRSHAPSWSWASLPFNSVIAVGSDMSSNKHSAFELHHADVVQEAAIASVLEQVKSGCQVKQIRVSGRLRLLLSPVSREVPWSELYSPTNDSQEPDLSAYLDLNIHSRDSENGMIMAYEVRKQPTLGQLDYLVPHRMEQGDFAMLMMPTELQQHELDMYCLEISDSVMLLLKQVAGSSNEHTFQRVGMSHNFRGSFFDGCDVCTLFLV